METLKSLKNHFRIVSWLFGPHANNTITTLKLHPEPFIWWLGDHSLCLTENASCRTHHNLQSCWQIIIHYSSAILTSEKVNIILLLLLCQLLRPEEESTSTQRYIDSRTVQPRAKGAWISVEVTETIKDWVSDPGQLLHQRRISLPYHSVCVVHPNIFCFLFQRIILAWSWASTVPAAPLSRPPTTLFPTRVRSWRPCLLVCCSCLCFHCISS